MAAPIPSPRDRSGDEEGIVGMGPGQKRAEHVLPDFGSSQKELGFGVWEGKTAAELTAQKDPVFAKWVRGQWARPKHSESVSAFKKRTKSFLTAISRKHAGRNIAVVTHGGFIKMLMLEAAGLDLRSYGLFQIRPASISVLEIIQGKARIMSVNDVCPLSEK